MSRPLAVSAAGKDATVYRCGCCGAAFRLDCAAFERHLGRASMWAHAMHAALKGPAPTTIRNVQLRKLLTRKTISGKIDKNREGRRGPPR